MRLSILYFDDDPGCLEVFRVALGDLHDVRTALTLGDARRLLSEIAPEVVISDQLMPEITGAEFLAEVAGTHPSGYRVLLTGGASVGQVLREFGTGLIHHFIPKPWTTRELEQMLERAELYLERGRGGGI